MPRVTKQQLIDEITELKVELAKETAERNHYQDMAAHNMRLTHGLVAIIHNITVKANIELRSDIERASSLSATSYTERIVGRRTEVTATWII